MMWLFMEIVSLDLHRRMLCSVFFVVEVEGRGKRVKRWTRVYFLNWMSEVLRDGYRSWFHHDCVCVGDPRCFTKTVDGMY